MNNLFRYERFVARRKFFKLFGGAFHLYAPDGGLIAYSSQKAFKLREDIRVYTDESMTRELLSIQADRIIDFSAAYKVYDSTTGELIGTLRRKGWTSLIRDSWELLDADGTVRGKAYEDSGWLAFLRRTVELFAFFVPQCFVIEADGLKVGEMRQKFELFVHKFHVDLSHDSEGRFPRPLAVAMVILLLAVEGREAS